MTAKDAGGAPTLQLPHEIHGAVDYGTPQWLLWAPVLAAFAAGAAAWWGWRRWRRRERPGARAAGTADPWDALRRRWSELPGRHPPETASAEFYGELSVILRSAIELASGVPATRMTTEELAGRLAGVSLGGAADHERARGLLDAADRARFADASAPRVPPVLALEHHQEVGRWLDRLNAAGAAPASGYGGVPSSLARLEGSR